MRLSLAFAVSTLMAVFLSSCANLFDSQAGSSLAGFKAISSVPPKIVVSVPVNGRLKSLQGDPRSVASSTLLSDPMLYNTYSNGFIGGYFRICETAFFSVLADWYETNLGPGETRSEQVTVTDAVIAAAKAMVQGELWDSKNLDMNDVGVGKTWTLVASRGTPGQGFDKRIELTATGGAYYGAKIDIDWSADRNRISTQRWNTIPGMGPFYCKVTYNLSAKTSNYRWVWTEEKGVTWETYLIVEGSTPGSAVVAGLRSNPMTGAAPRLDQNLLIADGSNVAGFGFSALPASLSRGIEPQSIVLSDRWHDSISYGGTWAEAVPAAFDSSLLDSCVAGSTPTALALFDDPAADLEVPAGTPLFGWLDGGSDFSTTGAWAVFDSVQDQQALNAFSALSTTEREALPSFLGYAWSWGSGAAAVQLRNSKGWAERKTVYAVAATGYNYFTGVEVTASAIH